MLNSVVLRPSRSATSREVEKRQGLKLPPSSKTSGSRASQYAGMEMKTPGGMTVPSERLIVLIVFRLNETNGQSFLLT